MVEACNYNVERSRGYRPRLFLKGVSYSILQWGFFSYCFFSYWNQKVTMIVLSDAVKFLLKELISGHSVSLNWYTRRSDKESDVRKCGKRESVQTWLNALEGWIDCKERLRKRALNTNAVCEWKSANHDRKLETMSKKTAVKAWLGIALGW